jgi:hypothetical protein
MTTASVTGHGAGARRRPDVVASGLAIVAAIALLVGGYEHLTLYRQGYRSIPTIGPLFLVNVVASAVVGVALLVRRDRLLQLAGLAIAGTTLGFFALSRTAGGVFGFAESGLDPSPHAAITLAAESVTIVALVASLTVTGRRRRYSGRSFTQQ